VERLDHVDEKGRALKRRQTSTNIVPIRLEIPRLQRTVIFPFSPRCCTSGYLLGGRWRGPVRYIRVHVGRPSGCVFNAP